jgi:hypothetical protein
MPRSKWFASILASILVLTASVVASAKLQDRSALQTKMESLRAQVQAKEQVLLAPSPEDVAAFAALLTQPDTGMARLMPRETYDGKLLTRGGGSYYSFARRSSEFGLGSDIGLEQGQLRVGFSGADFGFLTTLGDLAIDSVSLDQPGVSLLAAFNAPTTETEAREQARLAGTGFVAGGFTYRSFLPAVLNTTFVVRSINYRSSDLLVAFRVTRQDADGSLTLAWKKLRAFPVPQLGQQQEGGGDQR